MRSFLLSLCAVMALAGCQNAAGPGRDPCEGRQCGEAEGKDCGACPGATDVCDQAGQCVDLCAQRQCGEVEGVSCGACPGATEVCDEEGLCVDLCAGRECGEPVPGISCGQCTQPEICGLPGRCFVPGGCPAGMVEVGLTGVCIDPFEVTCSQMAEFLNEHGNECRAEGLIDPNGGYRCCVEGNGEEYGLYESDGLWQVKPGYEDYPLVGVSYAGARVACEHWGKKLCEREEWELACEGPEGTAYPYGDTYEPLTCNACRQGDLYPQCSPEPYYPEPVGSYPGCEGGYPGLFDMSGNVSEWVSGGMPPDSYYQYMALGGSAGTTSLSACRQPDRGGTYWHPYYMTWNIGFRCCYYLD